MKTIIPLLALTATILLGTIISQQAAYRVEALVGCSPDSPAGVLFEPAIYVRHQEGLVVAESLFHWHPAPVDPGDVREEDRRGDHLRLVAALITRDGEIEYSTLYPHPETAARELWQVEQAAAVSAVFAQYRHQAHVLLGEQMLREFRR